MIFSVLQNMLTICKRTTFKALTKYMPIFRFTTFLLNASLIINLASLILNYTNFIFIFSRIKWLSFLSHVIYNNI